MIAVAKQKSDETKSGRSGLVNMFVGDSVSGSVTPGAELPGEVKGNPSADKEKQISITFVDTIPLDTLPKNSSDVKPFIFMIVAPWQLREQFVSPDAGEIMGLTFLADKPSQVTAEMSEMIQEAGIGTDYTLYNVNRMFEENRSILFVIHVFTYVFVMMISLIAAANVFNTISTNIRLRRRELAMLRSIGMSDREFRKMMSFECILVRRADAVSGASHGGNPLLADLQWMVWEALRSILCSPGTVWESACSAYSWRCLSQCSTQWAGSARRILSTRCGMI